MVIVGPSDAVSAAYLPGARVNDRPSSADADLARDGHRKVFHLPAREPFDFGRSLAFLTAFPAMTGAHGVEGPALVRALREADRTVVARLEAAPPQEGPGLRCTAFADGPLTDAQRAAVADRLSFWLGLDDDLPGFYRLAHGDHPFEQVIEQLHGYHQVKFPSPFEMLCWAILAQRVPLPVARGMRQALVDGAGSAAVVDGREYRAFPAPEQLLPLGEDELLALVGNRRKAGYLHAMVRHFVELDEEFLRTGPLEEVRARLQAIPGIGPWSSSFVLIRGLGRTELLTADKEMLRAAARAYGRALDEDGLLALAERYGDRRGYWGHYLRVASA